MDAIQSLIAKAKESPRRVVLPEGADGRILEAARRLKDDGIAEPVLLGPGAVDGISCIDPETSEDLDRFAEAYAAQNAKIDAKVARRLVRKPLYFAGMMVRLSDAEAMIAGAANPTRRVIEAGLQTVGLKDGIERASSFFLIAVPDFQGQGPKSFVFADCAVNIDPTAEELADIALTSAASAEKLLGDQPRVAMLSFSTQGSASHERVAKVTRGLEIAKCQAPGLAIDGEFQADSALIAAVAANKVKGKSPVAGQANVLIFPDLDAGNIGYKLTQYFGQAQAVGPVLQGFAKPVADLSRGASVDEIIATTVVALALA
jgi:phosphate acetyltransferase